MLGGAHDDAVFRTTFLHYIEEKISVPYRYKKKFYSPIDSSQYITDVGFFLRKKSLDELPQLWSIFKGDMTFIGPRPALYNQYDLIDLRTKYGVHKLRPGITGLAQIKGRNSLSWEQKFKYDTYYVDSYNMCLDLKILIKTVFLVLRLKGITPDNQEIMPEFMGTEKNGPVKEG